jgi:hypothetical protein
MSHILFNIIVDMLAILIIPHLVDKGLSILQYADDIIIFLDHNLEQAKKMKLLLTVFEHLSGLKINFHKSEILLWRSKRVSR